MLRRFLLVGLFVVWPFLQGSIMQVAVANLTSILYLALQLQVMPYRKRVDDHLALGCSLSLSVMFLCTIFYKYASLVQLPDIRDRMSIKQRSDFAIEGLLLTIIFIGCVFGALGFSAVLLILQLKQDLRERQDKARAARARRLRLLKNGAEVLLDTLLSGAAKDELLKKLHPNTPDSELGLIPHAGPFHIFLSHNWQHGQSAMRIVKTRLRELLPDVEVFLDVDNLGGGKDHPHIDVSNYVLCYCTRRWFTNLPCVREIVRAVLRKKPCIALLEPDTSDQYAGHTETEARRILLSDDYIQGNIKTQMEKQVKDWRWEWDMPELEIPSGQQIIDVLFASAPVVWYRLSDPQDISMRLIGERLIPGFAHKYGEPYVQTAYVQDELEQIFRGDKLELAPFVEGRRFHLYVSEHNPGARGVAEELQRIAPGIKCTHDLQQLGECEHMMVLLSEITWTRGAATTAFVSEVVEATRMGVHRFLIHEIPGARLVDEEARHSCSFERFFMEDTTPKLLVKAKIYGEIAMNLAGDEWRKAGLIKTVQKLAKGGGKRKPVDSEIQQELDTHFPASRQARAGGASSEAELRSTRSLLQRERLHLGQESRSAPSRCTERAPSSSRRFSDFAEFEQMNVDEFEQSDLTARERLELKRAANKRDSFTPNETAAPTGSSMSLPLEAPLPPPADEPVLNA